MAPSLLVPPPGQTWGFASPGPAPLHPPCWKTGCLRQWGRRPKRVPLNAASQRTAPGPHLGGSSSGWGLGLSLSYSWPCALCLYFSVSLPISRVLCLSPCYACLSLALSSDPSISPCLAGGGAHGSSISGSLFNSDSSFPASDGSGARLSPPSAPPSPSQPYLAPGLPSHICLSSVSGSQNLVSLEPSPPTQTGSQPLEDRAAPSGGGGGEGGGPLTWSRALPSPSPPAGFIKQTGPYIARPCGPGSPRPPYMARRLR